MLRNELSEQPLISVGMTCFNAQDTIQRALNSAVVQTWENIEIIVVDDHSSDNSWNMICNAALRDNRIKPVRHEQNLGAAAARNTIIENSAGVFIAFFDDDDESLPNRIDEQYQAIQRYSDENRTSLVACFASGIRRYVNGYEYPLAAIGSQRGALIGELVVDYLLFNGRDNQYFYGAGTPTCALMIGTDILKRLGGFDKILRRVEDVDFAVRLALAGGHFIGCPQRLFIQYATDTVDKTPENNLFSELALLEKHKRYLQGKRKYHYAKQWFKIRYLHFSRKRFQFICLLTWFLLCHPISGIKHLMRSAPNRLSHEKNINQSGKQSS